MNSSSQNELHLRRPLLVSFLFLTIFLYKNLLLFFLTQIQRTLYMFASIYFSCMSVSVVIVFMSYFLVIAKRVDNHLWRLILAFVALRKSKKEKPSFLLWLSLHLKLSPFVHGRVPFTGSCPSNSCGRYIL